MKKNKIIKDLVHGYITIDAMIGKIIDHVSFQRLKGISQITAHHLYPSANHTRFEHSLGVMYLAMTFFSQLEPSIKSILSADRITPIEDRLEYLRENLRYAALLHDVGHGPFSHLGEYFFNKDEILSKTNDGTMAEEIKSGSKHELMSCYVIKKNFHPILSQNDVLKRILDYNFMFRIITGIKYNNKSDWDKDLMIEILNSPSVDVDKLDYLMRDNYMTGNVAPIIDIKRLVLSLTIDNERRLSYKPIGVSSLISLKDSRDFLYLWVYNHHTVVYTDFLYKTAIEHLSNELNHETKPENKIKLDDLFSTTAIAEKLSSDHDVTHYLYREFIDTKSVYSKKILSQLLERKFLKPIWKTIHEYKMFMEENFDIRQIKRIEDDINEDSDKNIKSIVRLIISMTDIESGNVFIIKRSNKFYSMSKKNDFYICYPEKGNVLLDDIMPPRDFSESYSDIAFYIFTQNEAKDKVQKAFVEIMKDKLYHD